MLDNGMQVVLIPNHRVPVITHMVWYKVGAADEVPGKSGLAHFLEHLMFKGTDNLPPGEFSKIVRALGGNDNAFTSQDFTAYFQSLSVDHLKTVMGMEAERMRGLHLLDEEVNSERLVILEERRQNTENDPRAHFSEQMRHALFANHTYGVPVIGWFHEMEDLSPEDARAFYDRWYAPNNAILVVSGDITMDQLRPLAEEVYGKLETREIPERRRTIVPPFPGQYRLVMRHKQIRQPSLRILYRVPSYIQNKEDSLALQVLEEIISGGPTTRLYKSLVVEQKLATSVGMSYRSSALNDGTLWISGQPAENVDMAELEEAIAGELRKLIADGVNENELIEAKTRMNDSAVFARDSLRGPAMIFGQMLATGSTIDDVEYWPHYISKVTAEQIQDVARRFLNPDGMDKRPFVTGYLLPEKEGE